MNKEDMPRQAARHGPPYLTGMAALYLTIVLLFVWGFAAGRYQVFPSRLIERFVVELELFFRGNPEDKTSIPDKIAIELSLRPSVHLRTFKPGMSDRVYKTIPIPGVKSRREGLSVFSRPELRQKGYIALYGTFDFENGMHGVVLIGPDDKVVKTWTVTEKALIDEKVRNGDAGAAARGDDGVYPHGFALLKDGSILASFDLGHGLRRLDRCGRVMWEVPAGFHHAITLDHEQKTMWGLLNKGRIAQVDVDTGKILKEHGLHFLPLRNPGTDIFGIRQDDDYEEPKWVQTGGGYWHENDVEPLPASIAAAFPDFAAGDLLISYRSLNLIFVIDPNTERVKWWSFGWTRRQHDPDWQSDGTITVFDNNMHRNFSRIIAIDPKTGKSSMAYFGKPENFYTKIKGKHQKLPNGGFLITSSEQGRVLEVTARGATAMEVLNTYNNAEALRLSISEAVWVPEDYFNVDISTPCGG